MNISETRKPQNGRFGLPIAGRDVDFRVSAHPTIHGENVVVRILDKVHSLLPLHELGILDVNLGRLHHLMAQPFGLIVITGPTGSGKTTTLYSMLQTLSTPEVNIMTLEEPVEYNIPWIRQAEIRDLPGRNFGEGIRSILRQDPDIILVGEVRDSDAAQMAMRAAMTGHQVYTTLHTHDVFGVLPRLGDLGVPHTTTAGILKGAMSQRLVRLLCPQCKIPEAMSYRAHPTGCEHCQYHGYRGRTAISEVLILDEDFEELIIAGASPSKLKGIAKAKGFQTMGEDARQKVKAGLTSPQEIQRVLGDIFHE